MEKRGRGGEGICHEQRKESTACSGTGNIQNPLISFSMRGKI